MGSPSADTSASLLERLRDRADQDAWRRLTVLYTPLLHVWLGAARLQAADVDDLTQRVLTVVVRKLPQFEHNGRPGAFRTWLRFIAANVLREFSRSRAATGGSGEAAALLEELKDPHSDLNRHWEEEHNRHLLSGLLELVKPEFTTPTWWAFSRQVLDEVSASLVATELGLSVNAVLIAKSRVLNRLRREARGLLE
jgi:RNA polymerase sigma-70 factor (ECF subfamily)